METGLGAHGSDAAKIESPTNFSAIFETYYARILRYLDALLRDSRLAEDLTQDTFVKAYQALARGATPENLNAWLHAIATNTAISALRRRRILAWLPLPTGENTDQRAPNRDLADQSADKDLLLRALARMSKLDAACLLLRFQQDLSYDELRHVLGLSIPAAKMRLCRARASFREIYLSLNPEADR
jgi:RNA polymerase sigma-70 factor (ECF subfamily)